MSLDDFLDLTAVNDKFHKGYRGQSPLSRGPSLNIVRKLLPKWRRGVAESSGELIPTWVRE